MPRPKKSGLSASDFIRTQPMDLTATQVVEAGKKQGLKFSANLVYAVRGAKKKRGPGKMGAAAAKSAGGSEAQFRRLVLDLGVSRANALVADVETALERVIRGG